MIPGIMNSFHLGAAGGADAPIDLQYRDHGGDNVTTDSYTFSSMDIGTAAGGRVVIVAYAGRSGNSLTSATIGGVSATKLVEQNGNHTFGWIAAIVPSGSTGDVVLNFNSNQLRCGIDVYAAYNVQDVSALSTDTENDGNYSSSLDVPEGGIALAGMAAYGSGSTFTWTAGVTEDNRGTQGQSNWPMSVASYVNETGSDEPSHSVAGNRSGGAGYDTYAAFSMR
jgi:hypothetical protein